MVSGRFNFTPSLQIDLDAAEGTTSEIPPTSDDHFSAPNADDSKPLKLSVYIYGRFDCRIRVQAESGIDWTRLRTSSHQSLEESSDAFAPLKAVAAGFSVILKYYDVWMPISLNYSHY